MQIYLRRRSHENSMAHEANERNLRPIAGIDHRSNRATHFSVAPWSMLGLAMATLMTDDASD